MLEQDSVHLVNARELLRDANEIAMATSLLSRRDHSEEASK
jgi:hypothetical protein